MALLKRQPTPIARTNHIKVIHLNEYNQEHGRLLARDMELARRGAQVALQIDELQSAPVRSSTARVSALIDVDGGAAPFPNHSERLAALHQERADLAAAREAIRGRLAVERRKGSEMAWSEIAPTYTAKTKTVVLALAELLRAQKDLHAFRGQIHDADLSWMGQPHFVVNQLVGDPNDDQSYARQLLNEAIRDRFVTAAEVAIA